MFQSLDKMAASNVHMAAGGCRNALPWHWKYLLELLNPGQHAEIVLIAQVHVILSCVPGIEGVEADHVVRLKGHRQSLG